MYSRVPRGTEEPQAIDETRLSLSRLDCESAVRQPLWKGSCGLGGLETTVLSGWACSTVQLHEGQVHEDVSCRRTGFSH